jgi:V/A-type H+-transporting ATPase subunit C
VPAETLVHLLRDNYTEAKIRGKKSFLLERQQLYSLAEFRTQTEILGFLADGPYGPELSKLQEGSTPVETERAIRLGFARSVHDLIATAKGSVNEFLIEYSRRFDAYDLAGLVIYKSQGRSWEEYLTTRQPLAIMKEKELRRLYSTEDLRQIGELVGDATLQLRLEGISLEELTPDRASLVRDIFNGWGEERFYNFIAKSLHGRDRRSCLPIIGTSIDLLNISIILRSKLLGIQQVQNHLVPVYWRLAKKSADLLAASEDLIQALDRASSLKHYRKALSGSRQTYEESKSLSFIEIAVRKYIVDLSREILLGFPYTIGVVLAFLVLKENETRNLAAVVSGVGAGLKPEHIRALVIT